MNEVVMKLTQHQENVLQFIKKYQIQSGIAPTVREICVHFGLKSPGGVHRILHVLIDKGYLTSDPGKNRAWRITELSQPPPASIPLLGKIAAGRPFSALENKEEDLPIAASFFGRENCFALHVQGDSMINAHIMDGDIAIIHQQTEADNHQIVAVMIEDIEPTATLKYFIKKQKRIELHPANNNYVPLIFNGDEQNRVKVIGQCVGIIRRT